MTYLVIIVFLPHANLLRNVIAELIFHVHVQLRHPFGFRENAFPCRLGGAVFGTCINEKQKEDLMFDFGSISNWLSTRVGGDV